MIKDRADKIIQLVEANPGIRYSEIKRVTGLTNGVLSHHISKIEKSGKIIIERTPRVARLYPCGTPQEHTIAIKHLKNPTSRKILTALLKSDLSYKDIVKKTSKSQSTVSICLKNMCDDSIIQKKFVLSNLVFQLTNRELMDSLIEKQQSFIESSANNISDIFSSL